jgi:hypothetical protein
MQKGATELWYERVTAVVLMNKVALMMLIKSNGNVVREKQLFRVQESS